MSRPEAGTAAVAPVAPVARAPLLGEVAALDGLRGLAALMVVASHAAQMKLDLVPGLSLNGIGKPGVYLFFVISAALLTAQWLQLDAAAWREPRTWARYALRRVARIYPLYAAVLLAAWALAPRGFGVPLPDGASVWRHATLQEGLGLYWSIPVECHYYLWLPLVAAWCAAPLPLPLRLGGLLGAGALAQAVWPAAQAPANSITLGWYLLLFLGGSAVALLLRVGPSPAAATEAPAPGARRWAWADVGFALALLATLPPVFRLWWPAAGNDHLHRAFAFWTLLWGGAVWALARGQLPAWAALLRRPFWAACGRWCFGLYLLHMPALMLAQRLPLQGPLRSVAAWLGLALAVALAAAASRWLEQPVQRWAAARWRRPS